VRLTLTAPWPMVVRKVAA